MVGKGDVLEIKEGKGEGDFLGLPQPLVDLVLGMGLGFESVLILASGFSGVVQAGQSLQGAFETGLACLGPVLDRSLVLHGPLLRGIVYFLLLGGVSFFPFVAVLLFTSGSTSSASGQGGGVGGLNVLWFRAGGHVGRGVSYIGARGAGRGRVVCVPENSRIFV